MLALATTFINWSLAANSVLGGVEIPHTKGLDGHSDADALMHAICDAILGALGEEDIGHFFPNTDPRWRGVPSKIFLEEAARQTAKRGGRIVNVDATVIAQAPKIYPHIAEMKQRIAAALGVHRQTDWRKGHHQRAHGFYRPRRRHCGHGGRQHRPAGSMSIPNRIDKSKI